MGMIKDRHRTLTIEEISSEAYADKFIPEEYVEQQPGFFETGNWLRFDVENRSNERDWLLELAFPLVYEIELYEENEDGISLLFEGGAAKYPFFEREINHRNFVFNLEVEQGQTKRFYMLAVGGGDLHPPISIWDKNSFIEKTEIEFIFLGVFYGIIGVMIMYNLFLYFSLRMRSYLYYVLVITFTLLGKLSINGTAFQYLWPNAPEWNLHAAAFWVALACIFILIFTREFLSLDHYVGSFKYFFYVLIPLNVAVLLALPFSHYIALYLMVIACFLTFATVLISAVFALARGARQARFYILGWLIFLTGVSITILERMVILPFTLYTEYAGQAALTIEVVLLSLALADRINIMRKEKDIAERKAKESQELAIQNLKNADALKDEFLAVTSHELRTPLYGMIGIAETLRDGAAGYVSNEMKKQLSMIIMSGQRLTHLVNEILDLSKLKYDSLTLDVKLVDLKAIIELVLAVSKPLLANKSILIVKEIDDNLPLVRADENRLQQILHNLIDNAMKYTDEGTITIRAFARGEEIVIQVTDTGHGIHEDQLEVIFDPFQQGETSESREFDGVGIGLNITKQLVDLHQGKIDVESKVGVGSTFTVTLPIYQEDHSIEEASVSLEDTLQSKIALQDKPQLYRMPQNRAEQHPKILVVDDEVVNLQVLMNQLSLNGYDVLTASNGEDVFPIVEKHDIKLIILDIMMPGMSGYEVCQTLRKTYTLMELPILMLTAKDQVQDKMLSFEAGANDYLVKPCDKQELLARVKTLVRVKSLNQELVHMNTHLEDKVVERTSELNILNENLQEMVEQRRQLLANIAHELGTPLTLIHNYIQSIQKGLIDLEDPHYRQLVTDKINVLNRLIDDLFDLSRLESGKISLNLTEFQLYEWLEQVYHKSKFAVEQKNREFSFDEIPAELRYFTCYFDQERTDQLFSNLISNAIKNTSETEGHISMSAEVIDHKRLMIAVGDNGSGISKEELPYIFERFYRKKSSVGEQFGTGLGLAIVKQIVESHRGTISVDSTVNEGTTFYIMLPVKMMDKKDLMA